jgi:hypothetical protein
MVEMARNPVEMVRNPLEWRVSIINFLKSIDLILKKKKSCYYWTEIKCLKRWIRPPRRQIGSPKRHFLPLKRQERERGFLLQGYQEETW